TRVKDVDEAMVEDALELVRQAEALTGSGLCTVEHDEPLVRSPVRRTGDRYRRHALDLDPWQIGDQPLRKWRGGRADELLEAAGLQLSNPQGFFSGQRTDRHEVP